MEVPLHIEVHDRTAFPEPPEFPIAQNPTSASASAANAAAGAGNTNGSPATSVAPQAPAAAISEDEGYVCGVARIALLDLAKGYTSCKFKVGLRLGVYILGLGVRG